MATDNAPGSGACPVVRFDFAAATRAMAACASFGVVLDRAMARRQRLVAVADRSWQGRYHHEFGAESGHLVVQSRTLADELTRLRSAIERAADAARQEQLRLDRLTLLAGDGARPSFATGSPATAPP